MGKDLPTPRYAVAKNLLALLSKSDMTPPTLAQRANVDRKTVNNYLNGRGEPRPDLVAKLAGVFGLSADDLYNPDLDFEAASNTQLRALLETIPTLEPSGIKILYDLTAQLPRRR